MAATIKFRRGSSAQWITNNTYVLASGEPGYEFDTGRFKIGNGVTAWSGLAYASVIPSGFLAGSGINIGLGTNGSTATISISGLISNPANNRILTSRDNTTTGIDAESNFTFDGTSVVVTGDFKVDNLKLDGNTLSSVSGNLIIAPSGNQPLQTDGGGNSRGNYSTDLQRYRTSATQIASGSASVIGGGRNNTASSNYTVVAGGIANTASGYRSAVLGGSNTKAIGQYSVVGAGDSCIASGDYGSILGGKSNRVSSLSNYSVVVGGENNSISPTSNNSASHNFIGGGKNNTISADMGKNTILAGYGNTISNYGNTVVTICGGTNNSVNGGYNGGSFIGGGGSNVISGGDTYTAAIVAGDGCAISASYSAYATIVNGAGNTISGNNANYATIVNGIFNVISSGYESTIVNGNNNRIAANYTTILGGSNNVASGDYGAILGGRNNNDGNYDSVFILGSGITATQADTTYVQNLRASNSVSISGTMTATSGTINNVLNTQDLNILGRYTEKVVSSSIVSSGLTLNLSSGNLFTCNLNSNISTVSISGMPTTSGVAIGFSLIFTADGTARTVTWPSGIKWAGGTAPTLTSTNNKRDFLSFISTNNGTDYLGFVGGQNY